MKFFVFRLKHVIIAAIALAAAFVIGFSVPRAVGVFNVNGREIPIYSVERDDNKIALTFDCAWGDEDVGAVLKTLDEYGCKATFFVTGEWASRCGASLKKIADAGHEIGNHSYNHADYTALSAKEITADLDKADAAIEKAAGVKPRLARAPSGGYNNTVVKEIEDSGRQYIQWSVDGIDYGDAEAESIYNRCVKKTKAGDIILLHTGTKNTANILPKIIEALECDYDLVTVSELVYSSDYTVDNTGRQFAR